MTATRTYDVLVVGGGINGVGIARDAAGRGLKVLLVEQGDLAGATSSASSKLAHGGLRYLETYEFRLVREALSEREVLLAIAPHLCWPLTFVLPHDPALRPAWLVRLGLFLYDRLATRSRLPASRSIVLVRDMPGHPLARKFERAFTYADCWLEDSRLVVLNAVDASERGASVRSRCRFLGARPSGRLWEARIQPVGASAQTVAARVIVNAAGPWADTVRSTIIDPLRQAAAPRRLRLVRGSHIVVPRVHDGPQAFIFQNADGRVVFVLPFEQDYTLIGTTDVEQATPADVRITEQETAYLCDAASRSLAKPVRPEQVVWSYAGLRALADDSAANPSKVTREYVLELEHADASAEGPHLLSVYGGKLTTYRKLAEHALEKLRAVFPGLQPHWTATAPLPGGDVANADLEALMVEVQRRHPSLPAAVTRRLVRTYGTRATRVALAASSDPSAGDDLGCGLTTAELQYLIDVEFARTAEDILWRCSKLGLRVTPAQRQKIEAEVDRLVRIKPPLPPSPS